MNGLSEIKKALVKQYSGNKMKLMLNYDQFMTERTINYIGGPYTEEIICSIERIIHNWEVEKEKYKKRIMQKGQESSTDSEASEEEEAVDDSFIVDDEDE